MTVSRLLRIARLRLRSLVRKDTVDTELDRELAFHFDQLVREKTADGLSPDEARRAAHRVLGNVALVEEHCRDERHVTWIHDLRQDVAYGGRMLRKHPGFTAVAAASLALGIGANAAVLGAIDALILEGLPVRLADRLVVIRTVPLENPSQASGASLPDYAAWRDRSRSFEAVGASIKWPADLGAEVAGAPAERITGQRVTPEWLSMLGIRPLLGRVFTPAEARPYFPAPVMVISHALWQRRFGADPDIVNKPMRVDGGVRTIIGVMPAEFRYQDPTVEYWTPLDVGPQPDGTAHLFGVTARLKPGVSVGQAQAELDRIAAELAIEAPARSRGWGVRIESLEESLFGWTREPLLTFEAAVALVLLIACANVAGLLLSRASARQREVALRVALGAGRGRILRQLLTESVLLSFAGGILGLLVAWLGLRALLSMNAPPGAPPLPAIGLNAHVLGLMALLSIGTGLACGVVPAIAGSHLDPIVSLKDPGPVAGRIRRRAFPRGTLVSAQLALALVLLIGSGLLMNSLVRLAWRDLNFAPSGLVRFDVGIATGRYAHPIGSYHGFPYYEISPPPSQTLERVYTRLRAVPGAEAVAGISAPPVDSFILSTMEVTLGPSSPGGAGPGPGFAGTSPARQSAAYFLVTPNFFATMRTPIVRGRDVTDRDVVAVPWVALVNETAARRFWPGEDPIGKRFMLDTVPEEQAREVVGVVRDIPTRHADPAQPVIYASYLQQPSRYRAPWAGLFGSMTFMLRRTNDPMGLVPAARQAVAEIDALRPMTNIRTVEEHMRAAMGKFRYFVLLVGVFAGMATLLAAIGTYGVMAYAVSQRTREIGIRRVLGAGRGEIVALVGRRALALVGVGLVCGVAGALALTRLIASQLWGVTPTDPATFAGVSLLLVAVAAVACVVPARRALAVDPTVALRSE